MTQIFIEFTYVLESKCHSTFLESIKNNVFKETKDEKNATKDAEIKSSKFKIKVLLSWHKNI